MTKDFIINHQHFFAYPQALHGGKTIQPEQFGKVAVLMGGESAEREVSLESGAKVLRALRNQGVDAHAIDAKGEYISLLLDGNFDRAFIILHGKYGEDGNVQGTLEGIHMPYTGSNVAASALAMDKPRAKLVLNALGLPTPSFGIAYSFSQALSIVKSFDGAIAVKPVAEGSSLGASKVEKLDDLEAAFDAANQYGAVLIEPWVEGVDIFVSVLGNEVFPSVQVQPLDQFYDYQAKYKSNKTEYFCPAPITPEQEQELRALAKKSFYGLGCTGWGRVDFVLDNQGKFWVLEVNTIPGMTPHSLVPLSAKAVGLSFEALVLAVLATSYQDETMTEQKPVSKQALSK